MENSALVTFLETQGYIDIREIPEQGLCGLNHLAFTVGLFCKMTEGRYEYRYCYPTLLDASAALEEWDGKGHPSGNWIKRKGAGGDLINPDLEEEHVVND